jgi:uncharacterized protein YjiS (DUF1127 family)
MSTSLIVAAIAIVGAVAFAVERSSAAALGRMRRWNAANELMRLDDRLLADIGLRRCEILSAVTEAGDVTVPRERRFSRAVDAPPPADQKRDGGRQARWQGGVVRPLDAAETMTRPANDPNQPRRSA